MPPKIRDYEVFAHYVYCYSYQLFSNDNYSYIIDPPQSDPPKDLHMGDKTEIPLRICNFVYFYDKRIFYSCCREKNCKLLLHRSDVKLMNSSCLCFGISKGLVLLFEMYKCISNAVYNNCYVIRNT